VVPKFRSSGVSIIATALSSSISDPLSASESSWLVVGCFKLPFQSSQFSVSKMLPTALSSSLLAGWRSICFIWWTFNTRVPLLTQLVVQVIFPTIYMQRHRHVECLTRMHSQPLLSRKCIPQLAFGCFEREIPSVKHVGFSCPATAPKSLEPWPLYAMSFAPRLALFRSCYQYSLYPMLGDHQPITRMWLEQTALQQQFGEGSHLWILTASSRSHITPGKFWPPLRHHVV